MHCLLHQSDCLVRVCILHQSYYSIRISYTIYSIWVLFSCKLCHQIRGLCTKDGLNQKFWAHLLSVMVCGLCLKVEIYQDMEGSHLTFCTIFKLKYVFSFLLLMMHMPNNSHSIKYHGNNVQSTIRTYPIIALHEYCVIFHVLELYSTNQIPLCTFRLCSIMCHFLVNNLHFITYSKCIFQPPEKEIHKELNGTDGELSMQLLPWT